MRMPDLRTPKVSHAYLSNTGFRNMKPCVVLLGLLAVSHLCLADPSLPRRGGRALMVRTHLKVGHLIVSNIPVTSFFVVSRLQQASPSPSTDTGCRRSTHFVVDSKAACQSTCESKVVGTSNTIDPETYTCELRGWEVV